MQLTHALLFWAYLVAAQSPPTPTKHFDLTISLSAPPSTSVPMTTYTQWDAPITLPSTTDYPIIIEPIASFLAASAALSSANAAASAYPTNLSMPHLDRCMALTGGIQPNSELYPGCGAMFKHINDCFDASTPWFSPYMAAQSLAFQSCLCETNASTPFTQAGDLWRNFTGCSSCMLQAFVPFNIISSQLARIQNFCSAEEPVAYLFLRRLLLWINSLRPPNGAAITPFPLTGSITLIFTLDPLFTATPPLANIAWGPSAPLNGNLRVVSPSLTTYTTTAGTVAFTATSLVSWIHTATVTATEVGGTTVVSDEGGAVSSALVSGLDGVASPVSSTHSAVSTTTQRCFGGCASAASPGPGPGRLAVMFAAAVVVLGVGIVVW